MGSKVVVAVCLLWLCAVSNGIFVTKNMRLGHNRAKNLGRVKEIGAQYASAPVKPPVLMIPGIGGSQLYAQLNKTTNKHWWCDKTDDWFSIWVNLKALIPGPSIECWEDNFQLQYNKQADQFENQTGVNILPVFPNTTLGFEFLDPAFPEETIYFGLLVDGFLGAGYERGVNLFGAPYDWRVTPNYTPGYYDHLQKLIENAYYSNNNTPVSVICHSMGNLFFLSLLNRMSQAWKDQFIFAHIAIAPPTVGAPSALNSLITGDNMGIPYFPDSASKSVAETFISTFFLLPHPDFYGDLTLVYTPKFNYTASDYKILLVDLGLYDMYHPYMETFNISNPFNPSGVNTYVQYGYNITTMFAEMTNNDFSDPRFLNGDGDGTVAIESLTFIQNWVNQTDKVVWLRGYANQEHVDILQSLDVAQAALCITFNYKNC